jgi:hypothetical protein
METDSGGTHYYRKGRVIFARTIGPHGVPRDRRLATARGNFAAALTLRALRASDGGRKGDWRKYLNYTAERLNDENRS